MINSKPHSCKTCGADISSKRADAQYCSGRCRMRYRRLQQKNGVIQHLAQIFTKLPNHSAHYVADEYQLQYWDATSGNEKKWSYTELQAMSISELQTLLGQKRMLLAGSSFIKLFKK